MTGLRSFREHAEALGSVSPQRRTHSGVAQVHDIRTYLKDLRAHTLRAAAAPDRELAPYIEVLARRTDTIAAIRNQSAQVQGTGAVEELAYGGTR